MLDAGFASRGLVAEIEYESIRVWPSLYSGNGVGSSHGFLVCREVLGLSS